MLARRLLSSSPARPTWLLEKFVARCGVASRREAKRLAEAGRVTVNGEVADHRTRVSAWGACGEVVEVDGVRAEPPPEGRAPRLLLYYKPVGEICHENSELGRARWRRKTVAEEVQRRHGEAFGLPRRLVAAGRLDVASEGLLPLTDSGALATAIMRPGLERVYAVAAPGPLPEGAAEELSRGVTVDGVRYRPAAVRESSAAAASALGVHRAEARAARWYEVRLSEGKNREVRRLFQHYGLAVTRLCRVAFGDLRLWPGAMPGALAEAAADVNGRAHRSPLSPPASTLRTNSSTSRISASDAEWPMPA